MYLSGNSLLKSFSFSFFCHHTSSFSFLLYCLSKSSTVSLAFFKFSLLSHVSSSAVHPFHHTKYFFLPRTHLLFIIFSTSYSFSSLITMGCGVFFFCPSTWLVYLCTLLTLTTGCIFTVLDSFNSIAFIKTINLTFYSLTNFSISFSIFLPTIWYLRSFVLSSTRSPTLYSLTFLLCLSTYFFMSSCTFTSTVFVSPCIFCIFSTNLFTFSNLPIFLCLNPILRSCLLFTLKGDTFVPMCTLLL